MAAYIENQQISKLPWYLRIILWLQRKKFNQILNPSLLWAYSPAQFLAFTLYYMAIERKSSPLDPVTRSLVMVRVAQLNWCAYCIDINASFLLERTQSKEKVLALQSWKESTLYTEKERAALAYAEGMTVSQKPVTPELMGTLRKYFSDTEVVELTGVIGYQNLSAKFNSALNIPPQGFCELPLGRPS